MTAVEYDVIPQRGNHPQKSYRPPLRSAPAGG